MVNSISTVTVELPGGRFDLLANLPALAALEAKYDAPFFIAIGRFEKRMRIEDVSFCFAAFATAGGRPTTPEDAVKAMGDAQGYALAIKAVQDAINAAMPPKKADDSEGGNVQGDPPA